MPVKIMASKPAIPSQVLRQMIIPVSPVSRGELKPNLGTSISSGQIGDIRGKIQVLSIHMGWVNFGHYDPLGHISPLLGLNYFS